MQFFANIFMQIVLAPTSPSPKKFLNEFAIISGPGLKTVGGQLPPFAPLPVATPMVLCILVVLFTV